MPIKKRKSGQATKYGILAMVLVGGGLVAIGIAALLLLPGNASTGSETTVDANRPAKVNFPAPDLNLHDLHGQPVSLADHLGQVLLVNNWATWCPPCRQEMPILEAYFRDHNHQGFMIVAIEAGDAVETVSEFISQHEMSFPVWVDPSSSALNKFRNNYLPSSYLINEDGQVIMVWSGAVTRASLEQNITPLLLE